MAITKTIGGDRIGSGKKMQAHLHNYNRSTHNLSEKWASSANCGILYPCFVKPAMRGDAFDIKVNADARTIPTVGPLFGSFLFQVHFYQCPVRLYQSILHNNPQAIGLKMSQVKLPKLKIHSDADRQTTHDYKDYKFSNTSLLKYLGMSGIGTPDDTHPVNSIARKINAVPALAYYDIFKTYYANKQEDDAYVITTQQLPYKEVGINAAILNSASNTYDILHDVGDLEPNYLNGIEFFLDEYIPKEFLNYLQLNITVNGVTITKSIREWNNTYKDFIVFVSSNETEKSYRYILNNGIIQFYNMGEISTTQLSIDIPQHGSKLDIVSFPLKNIDDMRYDILSHHNMGESFVIDNTNAYAPYNTLVDVITENTHQLTKNHYPCNGLVLKTYQSDIFNNWLNAEWIEGENGVNELSKVQIIDGKFSMDALSFAQKQYDMLNRIAVAGNTYEDWQDVVYEPIKRRQIESPMFIGGMSQEIYFDEIVQTAPADGDPLGTLGGRGAMSMQTKKGGTIHVKCDEACFIIGIASLTPRIYQTQGNEFYMTELESLDDFHKPAMDGIGFQDLVGERMAWWDTKIKGENITHRSKIGKLPAWIEYMTSYDRAYGDFAETDGKGYMILNRNYELDDETGLIKDVTTYIDPTKYNYVFANTSLDAQNFWLEIHFETKARRLMSARIMPNV